MEGLETLDYFDNLLQKERFTELADAITFDDEVVSFTRPPLFSLVVGLALIAIPVAGCFVYVNVYISFASKLMLSFNLLHRWIGCISVPQLRLQSLITKRNGCLN